MRIAQYAKDKDFNSYIKGQHEKVQNPKEGLNKLKQMFGKANARNR